jgi:hypothetical protein
VQEAAEESPEGTGRAPNAELFITHHHAMSSTAAQLPEGEGEMYHLIRVPANAPKSHTIVEHPIYQIKARCRQALGS